MKKVEFYNSVKTSVQYLSGLSREAWYNDGGDIVLKTSKRNIRLSCNRNVVTLYVRLYGENETVVTDYNKGYKDNMVALTVEKIGEFLTI